MEEIFSLIRQLDRDLMEGTLDMLRGLSPTGQIMAEIFGMLLERERVDRESKSGMKPTPAVAILIDNTTTPEINRITPLEDGDSHYFTTESVNIALHRFVCKQCGAVIEAERRPGKCKGCGSRKVGYES